MYPSIDNEELSLKVHRILLKMLKEGKFAGRKRLPPEAVLVEKLGVSRSVIRDALSLLEAEGFITRKRGVGTVINEHVLSKTPRLDLENDFLLMLESEGYKARTDHIRVTRGSGDQSGDLLVEKRVMADETPAIFILDRIPGSILPEQVDVNTLKDSIYPFLRNQCSRQPTVVMLDIMPRSSDPKVMEMLAIGEHQPYLEVTETGYDLDQNIVITSTLCYRADLFHFSILRKEAFTYVK